MVEFNKSGSICGGMRRVTFQVGSLLMEEQNYSQVFLVQNGGSKGLDGKDEAMAAWGFGIY